MKVESLFLLAVCLAIPLLAEGPVPAPWKSQDIGAVKAAGKTDAGDKAIVVQGAGDLWGTADSCHFVYQPVHGDVELVASVKSIDNPGGVAHAKASLCLRESLDAGARVVTMCMTATDGTQLLFRDAKDGKTTHFVGAADAPKSIVPKAQFPCWLKLVRHGNDISGYESIDGKTWQLAGQAKLDLPADALIGLAATSHKPDVLTTDTFEHVTLTTGSK